jgi:hypothetical protein
VTTRGGPPGRQSPEVRQTSGLRGPDAAVPVGAARPRHVARAPPPDGGAVVVAARSASGEPASSTPRPGNTADSSAGAGRRVRSLCANKRAAAADACWRKPAGGRYTGPVPREGLLPAGPPGRLAKAARAPSFRATPTAALTASFYHAPPARGRSLPPHDQITPQRRTPGGRRRRRTLPRVSCVWEGDASQRKRKHTEGNQTRRKKTEGDGRRKS